jgi:hypothetical protein
MRFTMLLLLILMGLPLLAIASEPVECAQLFNCEQVTAQSTKISFDLGDYDLEDQVVNGVTFRQIQHPLAAYTVNEGFPEMPMFSVMLQVPNSGNVDLQIVDSSEQSIGPVRVLPSQGVHLDGQTRSFADDSPFMSQSGIFPAQTALLSTPAVMRGVRLVVLTVFPFANDPTTGNLYVRDHITVRVVSTGGTGENEVLSHNKRSRYFDGVIKSVAINAAQYQSQTRDVAPDFQAPCILFIYPTNTDLGDLVNSLAEWKKAKGFEVHVVNTTTAGTSNTQIKSYIQTAYNTWDNPPEYVVLVGDANGAIALPTWTESFSGYNGEGDHPYVCLEGDDILPEAYIGRLSISSLTDMQTIISKINIYERQVNMSFPAMYQHSTIAGDTNTSTGLSAMITCKYAKERILSYDPDHTFTELYPALGNLSPANIDAGINQGSLYFNFRGYISCGGWSTTNIDGLTNVNKLVNSICITCDTGTFASTYAVARSEAMLRAGTPAAPKGGACGVGMATSGTHTQFNNIVQSGIYYGLFSERMVNMGQAVMRGKLALYVAYANVDYTDTQKFTHWCNLMGDPSMAIWHGMPIVMNVSHAASVPVGRGYIDVHIQDANMESVPDAWVSLYSTNGTVSVSGYTNVDGDITLTFDPTYSGSISLIATKCDYITYLGSITVGNTATVSVASVTIDDDNNGESVGNGNSQVNPGETVELVVDLTNLTGSAIAAGATAVLTLGSTTYATVQDGTETYGAMTVNGTGESIDDFGITIAGNAPDRFQLPCNLAITVGGTTYQDRFYLEVNGVDLDVTATLTTDTNSVLDPGEDTDLRITLTNNGRSNLTNVSAVLTSLDGLVRVTDNSAAFGTIDVGQAITCTADDFSVSGLALLVPGMEIPMRVVLTGSNGYSETETFNLPIGVVSVSDPMPPDGGNYVCYDMEDTSYIDYPTYEWIEIDPSEGGSGTNTGLSDNGEEQDETVVINLPFSFKFYGTEYDIVDISTNGFLSFTESEQNTFRNWPVPGPKGPSPMVAAFWDDLYTTGGGVYTWYDEANHQFIIEWSKCKNSIGNALETFQIILQDQAFYQTSNFNGPIKIQYKAFNNCDSSCAASGAQGNYCTIGLEDATELLGLQYTYDNDYPTCNATLGNETAIYFTGRPVCFEDSYLILGDVYYHDADGSGIIDAGEQVNIGIEVDNVGLGLAEDITATISTTDAYVTINSASADYSDIGGSLTGLNAGYFSLTVAPNCPNNHVVSLVLELTDTDGTWAYNFSFPVMKSSLSLSATMINDVNGDNDGILDSGENAVLVINLSNNSESMARDVQVALTCDSPMLSINETPLDFGDIPVGAGMQKAFPVTIAADAPIGTALLFTLSTSSYGGFSQTYTFQSSIGVWGFQTDLESSNAEFSGDAGWQWGTPTIGAHSGTHAWATGLTTNYANNCNLSLNSPEFYIGSQGQLSFYHNYQTQTSMDGGNVKISVDNGVTWHVIVPATGYPTGACNSTNAGIPGEPCFSGYSGGWRFDTFDLSAYAGQYAHFRWQFGSGPSVVAYGWTIDDITISGCQLKTGVVNGTVTLNGGSGTVSEALVGAGIYYTRPANDGSYTLYTPAGSFDVAASLEFYEGAESNIAVTEGQTTNVGTLTLNSLPAPAALTASQVYGSVTLNWTHLRRETRNQSRTEQSRYTFQHFNVYRQKESAALELVADNVSELTYIDNTIDSLATYRYFITAVYAQGESEHSNTADIFWDGTHVPSDDTPTIPTVTGLTGNSPNPFNPDTTIEFSLAQSGRVELMVYNLRGQRIRTLINDNRNAGTHSVVWNGIDDNGRPVASGMYFYRLKTAGFDQTRKALLLK